MTSTNIYCYGEKTDDALRLPATPETPHVCVTRFVTCVRPSQSRLQLEHSWSQRAPMIDLEDRVTYIVMVYDS